MKKIKKIIVFLFASLIFLFASCQEASTSDERVELTYDMIVRPGFVKYTGSEIVFDSTQIEVRYNGYTYYLNEDFTASYQNNVSVGIATLIVTMNENHKVLKGSATTTFEITSLGLINVNTIAQAKEKLLDEAYSGVVLKSLDSSNGSDFVVSEDDEILIPQGKRFIIGNGNIYPFYNYGTIKAYGSLSLGYSSYTYIYNLGNIECYGSVEISGARIFNSGVFLSEKTILNYGQVYTNSELNINTVKDINHWYSECIVRKEIKDDDINLESMDLTYTGKEITPIAKYSLNNNTASLRFTYENNINAGLATVRIKVALDDYNYFSKNEIVKTFEIKRASIIVKSEEELIQYHNDPNYDTYEMIGPLELNQDFKLENDETLISKYSLTINSKFENNGTIDFYKLYLNNNFNNNGTLSYSYGEIVSQKSIINSGIIIAKSIESNEIINSGKIDVACLNMTENSKLENSFELNIGSLYSKSKLDGTSILNYGTITNSSELVYINKEASFTNNGIFENTGNIYLDKELGFECNNSFVKKDLATCVIDLEYDEILYDMLPHKPSFTVNGENVNSLVNKEYKLENEVSQCISVGLYELVITSNTEFSKYYGSTSKNYQILSTTTTISSQYEFKNKGNNANWSGFIIEKNLELSKFDLTIYSNQYLDTNGYTISLLTSSSITNLGNINIKEANIDKTNSKEALIIYNNCKIINKKEIANDGIIMIKYGVSRIDNNGIITGSGTIYTYEDASLESETNTIYIRQNLRFAENVSLEYQDVLYDNTIKNPKVLAHVGELNLDDDYFNIQYDTNCLRAGTYSVIIEPKDEYDHYFIGSVTKSFNILSNVKKISTSQDFSTNSFDIDVYDRYELDANILQVEDVAIPDYAIFDMNTYRINNIGKYKIDVSLNTDILIDITSESDFDIYYSEVTTLNLKTNLVNEKSLIFKDSTYFLGKRNESVIDFAGYSFNNYVHVSSTSDYNIRFTNSSSTISNIIDYDDNIDTLCVDGGNISQKSNVDFKFKIDGKFKVAGIRLRYSSYGMFDFSADGIDVDLSMRKQDDTSDGVSIYGRTKANTKIEFKNCKIKAYTCILAGNGFALNIDNCILIASGPLAINCGACIILDRYNATDEASAQIRILNSSFTSLYSYGIFIRYAPNNHYSIYNEYTTWNCKLGEIGKHNY